jgi:hypothetical protein
MNKLCSGFLAAAALAFALGCSHGTSGGPGATGDQKKQTFGQADNTFSLEVPLLSTTIKQGESKVVKISIKRGKNFDEDVTLKFADLPKGVSVEPLSPMIKHADKEADVTIKVADDATPEKHTLHVMGHPTKGPEAENKFDITVDKK